MSCEKQKVYTLRHFLFYMAVSCVAGAIIGAAAMTMDWSQGLIYAVAIPVGFAINLTALRESLFAPAPRPRSQRAQPRL